MQPIWNAVFSSDSTKAASFTANACWRGSRMWLSPDSLAICASALLPVCASMKRDSGASARSSASSMLIWSWS
ncbi:hypothetical protein D3C85_1816050 [compost metagenome]